jgi:hypothetical protein
MTCAEFKEPAAAWALGALDRDEAAACDAHLAEPSHDGCAEALADARRAVDAMGASQPPVPPSDLVWARVARAIADRPARRAARGWAVVPWAAAAAAVALLIWQWRARVELREERDVYRSIAGRQNRRERDLRERLRDSETERDLTAGQARLAFELAAACGRPSVTVVPLAAQDGGAQRATLVRDPASAEGPILLADALPPQRGVYQAWVIRGEARLSAGVLEVADQRAALRIPADLAAQGIDAVAITVEPREVPQPTGPIVLLARLDRSPPP